MPHASASRPVRDFVLPVCAFSYDSGRNVPNSQSRLVGTAFVIGKSGFALTASHVMQQVVPDNPVALSEIGANTLGHFLVRPIVACEHHPTEDVALIRLDDSIQGPRESYLAISGAWHSASLEYSMWAYPDVIANEVRYHGLPPDAWQWRPDLVFFKGYVRRRMPFSPNPSYDAYRGSIFYELSEVAGACCSGAPIIHHRAPSWDVVGLYVGEVTGERRCGYAVSLEAVANWKPNILGRTIREESLSSL